MGGNGGNGVKPSDVVSVVIQPRFPADNIIKIIQEAPGGKGGAGGNGGGGAGKHQNGGNSSDRGSAGATGSSGFNGTVLGRLPPSRSRRASTAGWVSGHGLQLDIYSALRYTGRLASSLNV